MRGKLYYTDPNIPTGVTGKRLTAVDIAALEARIDELIKNCDELREENRALKNQQDNLIAERASLIEKSELARSRVESMIARLKAMELGT
ncbi:MAG: TIGR02449 family protein [Thiotrichales bacterium]|nr:TIGR02449 family protein [Thiotrichales bacterium]